MVSAIGAVSLLLSARSQQASADIVMILNDIFANYLPGNLIDLDETWKRDWVGKNYQGEMGKFDFFSRYVIAFAQNRFWDSISAAQVGLYLWRQLLENGTTPKSSPGKGTSLACLCNGQVGI